MIKDDKVLDEEGVTMIREKCRSLDMGKINNKKSRIISAKSALSDVTPINWSEDVLLGKKKITVGRRK